jgi:ribosomal protein L40E
MSACAICLSPLGANDATTACPACAAPYHADCWSENRGCAVYGCRMVPKTEKLESLEIPPAFWGREDKNCPECNALIAAMAVRCRHCGASVAARPEEKASYQRRQAFRERTPMLRRGAVALVILSLIPIVAAFAAAGGWLFYRGHRAEIRKVPGSCDGLFRIAIGVATAQTVIITLALVGFWLKSSVVG